jgi:undecaprenyl-diphosphatase
MELIYAIILGIVEGITEFLPVSSTAHLLATSEILTRLPGGDKVAFLATPGIRDTFVVFIQIGAILAVVAYFLRDLLQQARKLPSDRATQRFWFNVALAFVPAGLVGFFFREQFQAVFDRPWVYGVALILGGIVFLWIESRQHKNECTSLEAVTPIQALLIGIAQITALIPGVSRSGSSIVGGLLVGLDRMTATRFSFYLAIPTLGIATVYELFSSFREGKVNLDLMPWFAVGTLVSFIVAWASIAWLLRYVSTNSFRAFGIYRIIVGIVIIILFTLILRA